MNVYSKTQYLLSAIVVCLLLVIILGACGPSQAEVDAEATGQMIAQAATQTAVAPTATPPPTFTSIPTNTSTPTNTPTPTDTPIPPTDTPTPTNTPIPSTPTPTIIYGQVKVCFKLEEGVKPSTGLDVRLIDSEGNGEDKPVTTNANRCYTFKKVMPGLYRIEALGAHFDGRLASGNLKDVVVQPDETVEVEVIITLV